MNGQKCDEYYKINNKDNEIINYNDHKKNELLKDDVTKTTITESDFEYEWTGEDPYDRHYDIFEIYNNILHRFDGKDDDIKQLQEYLKNINVNDNLIKKILKYQYNDPQKYVAMALTLNLGMLHILNNSKMA